MIHYYIYRGHMLGTLRHPMLMRDRDMVVVSHHVNHDESCDFPIKSFCEVLVLLVLNHLQQVIAN